MRIGAKTIETRSWATRHRGPLLISAAKKIPPDFGEICHREPFRSVLEKAGYTDLDDFEFGRLVCVVNLKSCLQVNPDAMSKLGGMGSGVYMNPPSGSELAFGDYTPGRFGWITTDRRIIRQDIPIIGRQRVFEVRTHGCLTCGLRKDRGDCDVCLGDGFVMKAS